LPITAGPTFSVGLGLRAIDRGEPGERGLRRVRGMVGIGRRRSPYGHDRIADEFIDVAISRLNLFDQQAEISVCQARQLLRAEPAGQCGKAG
jgi:hypothetical protein